MSEANPDQEKTLTDPEDYQRRHLLLYEFMHQVNVLLARLSRRRPPLPRRSVPLAVLLIPCLCMTALGLIPLLIFYYDPPATAWLYLYLGLALFILLAGAEMIIRKVVFTTQQLNIETFKSKETWDYLSKDIPHQALVGVGWAVISTAVAVLLYQDIFKEPLVLPAYLYTAITGFFWGTGAYVSTVSSMRFTEVLDRLAEDQLPLYDFDPQCSPLIKNLAKVFEWALWVNSAAVMTLLIPLIFIKKTPLLILAAMLFSIMGVIILGGAFMQGLYQLNKLVGRKKQQTLTDLQTRIETFYKEAERLDPATFTQLQNLMALHDQVNRVRSLGLSATGIARFLSTFILPLITALYANQEIMPVLMALAQTALSGD
ncbi:MAG: hypothetical protein AB1801_23700 [Chloroflexota bacterium]